MLMVHFVNSLPSYRIFISPRKLLYHHLVVESSQLICIRTDVQKETCYRNKKFKVRFSQVLVVWFIFYDPKAASARKLDIISKILICLQVSCRRFQSPLGILLLFHLLQKLSSRIFLRI